MLVADDYETVVRAKRILAPDFHLPPAKTGRPGEAWFAKTELPAKARIRFEVVPLNCFGGAGNAIEGKFST